jgi:3-hydroxyisobutyrate dehydrogenase-like beta-hydroxyacid dehydrogenase
VSAAPIDEKANRKEMIMKIGFIGLGLMGGAMARNLLLAGHALTVWDREEAAMRTLAADGATAAASASEAAQGDVVFSMLPHDEAIRGVVLDSGWLEVVPKTLVHVNCSTISVAFAQEMTERHRAAGIAYVGAPVFGRPDAAASAQLHLIVAGPEAALSKVQPLFAAIGQKTWPVGSEPFWANLVKIGGNLMIASAIEAMAEATSLGQAYGLERGAMLDIYLNTLFPSPVYRGYGALITAGRYEPPGFKLKLGLKDVKLALEAGDAARVPLPFGSVLRDALLTAAATGDGEKDWAALANVALKRSGQV